MLRRRVQTPDPDGHREKREDMKAKIDTQKSASNRAVSPRLHALWWRPSADRKSAARPRGSVPKRGRHSSRSAAQQSCVAQRASRHPFKPLSRSEGGARTSEASPRGMPSQGPGDRTWSRRTSTLVHHKGEATAREDPARVNRRKAAYSERCPQAPRRRPSPWSGDMGRDWIRKLAV